MIGLATPFLMDVCGIKAHRDVLLKKGFLGKRKNCEGLKWSERRDSNSQPLAPKASALPIAPRSDSVLILKFF